MNNKKLGNNNIINSIKNLELNNNLLLAVNKRIIAYPHNKVIPMLGKYQSILYRFNQNLKSNKGILFQNKWVIKILNSFFTSLYCIINKPVFIDQPNKLIIRISFYQSKTYNEPLFFDQNSNIIFNSFNKEGESVSKKAWVSYFRDLLNLNQGVQPSLNKGDVDYIPFKLIKDSVKNTNLIRQKLLDVKAIPSLKSGLTIKNWESKYLQLFLPSHNRRLINKTKLLPISPNNLKLPLPLLSYLAYKNSIESINDRKISLKIKKTLIKNLNKRIYLGANKYSTLPLDNTGGSTTNYYKISNLLNSFNSIVKGSKGSKVLKIQKNMQINKIKLEEQNKKLLSLIIKFYLLKMHPAFNNNNNREAVVINPVPVPANDSNKILQLIYKHRPELGNKLDTASLNKDILFNKIKGMLLAYNALSSKTQNYNKNIVQSNRLKFKYLGILLSKIFGKNVEIQLIKLHNIGLDQDILAKAISSNSKNYKLRIILNKLWKKIQVNSGSKFIYLRKKALLNSTLVSAIANKLTTSLNNKGKNINFSIGKQFAPGKMLGGLKSKNLPIFKNIRNNTLNQIKIKIPTKILKTKFNQITNIINQKNQIKNPISNALINDNIENPEIFISKPLTLAKVTGIKIKVAGRLAKERIVPKKTVKTIQVGSLSKQRVSFVNSATFTSKNKKGAFSIKISMSHSFR